MMLPMRISVSVTPAAWAGWVAAEADTRAAASKDAIRLAFVIICINMASNAKLPGACDTNPAATIIAGKIGELKSNVVAAVGWVERSDTHQSHRTKLMGIAALHPSYASAQFDIQPSQCIDRHAVAGIDQHGRGFGLDDRGAGQGVAGVQIVEGIDRNFAPAAEEGLPLAARRTGAGCSRLPRALVLRRDLANSGDAGVDEDDFLTA